LIKSIYKKLTANFIITGEKKLDVSPVRSETKQGCYFSPLLFNLTLKILENTVRPEKDKGDI
jgi:hypothetical protein